MKYDIITIGDASEDVFIKPHDLKTGYSSSYVGGKTLTFELGEKIPVDEVNFACGGTAANVAVGMKRLGLKSSVLTVIGEDLSGGRILENFDTEDVDTTLIDQLSDMRTNFSVVIVTPDGERTIFVYHGLKDYSKIKVKKTVGTKWYFLGPIGDGAENLQSDLVEIVAEKSTLLAWNPGALQVKQGATEFRHLLKNTSILFMNREEAIKFTNYPVIPKEEEVLKRLHMLGAKIVVITNGKDGVKAYDGKSYYKTGILDNVRRVDATGAGDSFSTAFLGRMILGGYDGKLDQDLIIEALKYGIIESTSVVAKIGAQAGLLSQEELDQGVKDHPRMKVEVY